VTAFTVILPVDSRYPQRLRQLAQRMPTLTVRGRWQILQSAKTVAIVGSRAASTARMDATTALAATLADQGIVTVSGGALGIDAAAHLGSSSATIVVLGSGIENLYPSRNQPMFDAVVAAGGALVSPFADDAPPRSPHFVQRNRYIAALADVVVVMEAQLRSGSLSTAHAAAKLGRKVLAMPGSPGTNWLLSQGATVFGGESDIIAALAGAVALSPLCQPSNLPADPCAAEIFTALSKCAMDPESLANQIGISIGKTLAMLAQLTASAHVVALPGQSYMASSTFVTA
jgi:DNA processing protein